MHPVPRILAAVLTASIVLSWTSSTQAQTERTWDGGGTDTRWHNPANWDGDAVPAATEVAVFDALSSRNCTIDRDVIVLGIDIRTGYEGTISTGFTSGLEGNYYDGVDFDTFVGTHFDASVNYWTVHRVVAQRAALARHW